MLVRLTNICLLLLVLDAHFCICYFNQKEKKRKKSIITSQTISGTALFRENRPLLYVDVHSIESCIMPNPIELCLLVYLFSFNLFSSDVGVGGGVKKWPSSVRPSVQNIVSTTFLRRHIRLS